MIVLFVRVLLWLAFAGLLYWILIKLIPPKLFTLVGGIVVAILIGFSFYEPTRVVTVPDLIWKVFIFPFKPLGIALILFGVSLFRVFKESKDKILKSCLAIAVALLFLGSVPLINQEVVKLYEKGYYPKADQQKESASVIVLLGQGTTEPLKPYANAVQLTDSGDRLLYVAKLYKEQARNNPLVIISAGQRDSLTSKGKPLLEGEDIAQILKTLVEIPKDRLIIDNQSRDIRSSAVNIKKALDKTPEKDKSILLVTSAIHMWRSQLTFEQSGLKVLPRATDFYSVPTDENLTRKITIEDCLPTVETLTVTTKVVEDLFGVVYYFLRGWLTLKL